MPRASTNPFRFDIPIPPEVAAKLALPALIFGMAVTTAVLATALYGPEEYSERAFRLIDYVKNLKKANEPEKPQPPRQARTRTGAPTREPAPVA